eukprot:g2450.t1
MGRGMGNADAMDGGVWASALAWPGEGAHGWPEKDIVVGPVGALLGPGARALSTTMLCELYGHVNPAEVDAVLQGELRATNVLFSDVPEWYLSMNYVLTGEGIRRATPALVTHLTTTHTSRMPGPPAAEFHSIAPDQPVQSETLMFRWLEQVAGMGLTYGLHAVLARDQSRRIWAYPPMFIVAGTAAVSLGKSCFAAVPSVLSDHEWTVLPVFRDAGLLTVREKVLRKFDTPRFLATVRASTSPDGRLVLATSSLLSSPETIIKDSQGLSIGTIGNGPYSFLVESGVPWWLATFGVVFGFAESVTAVKSAVSLMRALDAADSGRGEVLRVALSSEGGMLGALTMSGYSHYGDMWDWKILALEEIEGRLVWSPAPVRSVAGGDFRGVRFTEISVDDGDIRLLSAVAERGRVPAATHVLACTYRKPSSEAFVEVMPGVSATAAARSGVHPAFSPLLAMKVGSFYLPIARGEDSTLAATYPGYTGPLDETVMFRVVPRGITWERQRVHSETRNGVGAVNWLMGRGMGNADAMDGGVWASALAWPGEGPHGWPEKDIAVGPVGALLGPGARALSTTMLCELYGHVNPAEVDAVLQGELRATNVLFSDVPEWYLSMNYVLTVYAGVLVALTLRSSVTPWGRATFALEIAAEVGSRASALAAWSRSPGRTDGKLAGVATALFAPVHWVLRNAGNDADVDGWLWRNPLRIEAWGGMLSLGPLAAAASLEQATPYQIALLTVISTVAVGSLRFNELWEELVGLLRGPSSGVCASYALMYICGLLVQSSFLVESGVPWWLATFGVVFGFAESVTAVKSAVSLMRALDAADSGRGEVLHVALSSEGGMLGALTMSGYSHYGDMWDWKILALEEIEGRLAWSPAPVRSVAGGDFRGVRFTEISVDDGDIRLLSAVAERGRVPAATHVLACTYRKPSSEAFVEVMPGVSATAAARSGVDPAFNPLLAMKVGSFYLPIARGEDLTLSAADL